MSAVMDAGLPRKRSVVLQPARMGLAEALRRDHVVNAEEGTTTDDILDLGYFAHVARDLSEYDHIEVRDETGQWVAEFIVTEVGPNYAKTVMTRFIDLTKTTKVDVPEAYRTEWKGPHLKWTVIRNADNEVVQKDLPKKDDALVWLRNHLQVVAGNK